MGKREGEGYLCHVSCGVPVGGDTYHCRSSEKGNDPLLPMQARRLGSSQRQGQGLGQCRGHGPRRRRRREGVRGGDRRSSVMMVSMVQSANDAVAGGWRVAAAGIVVDADTVDL